MKIIRGFTLLLLPLLFAKECFGQSIPEWEYVIRDTGGFVNFKKDDVTVSATGLVFKKITDNVQLGLRTSVFYENSTTVWASEYVFGAGFRYNFEPQGDSTTFVGFIFNYHDLRTKGYLSSRMTNVFEVGRRFEVAPNIHYSPTIVVKADSISDFERMDLQLRIAFLSFSLFF